MSYGAVESRTASAAGIAKRPGRVLVTDFDGTLTRHDFYRLAIERLIPPETPDFWAAYRAGEITHFEALQRYFAAIRGSEAEVLQVARAMELDPRLPASIERLRRAGWDVIVTSAGCDWYIQRLLRDAGVTLTVYANPGHYRPGAGLVMERPTDSPFASRQLGVDKAGVVRHCRALGAAVAFAGDGFPDVEPARLVESGMRFARGDLAEVLAREGLAFHPFCNWSEIVDRLLAVAVSVDPVHADGRSAARPCGKE